MRYQRCVPAIALALSVLATTLIAHDDDGKIRDRQPPYLGPAIFTGVPRAGAPAPDNPESFSQVNVTLLALFPHAQMSSTAANSCWGYTSPSGREYAIIGLNNGTAWVEVTTPNQPVLRAKLAGPSSTWRDVKVRGQYAYVGSEGGGGIQIFDMANIDAGTVTLVNSIAIPGTQATHTTCMDEVSGFLYMCGGSNNGLRIYDLNQNPTNPPLAGTWSTKYVHEAQIVTYTTGPLAGKQIAYCCTGFNGGFDSTGLTVLDVTNKANIVVMDEGFWPNPGYSHQAWLSTDRKYLYLNDELDEPPLPSTTIVFDVQDPTNLILLPSFTNGNPAITHNNYVRGTQLLCANYRSGLRIFDLAVSPTSPPEVGWFDTYPTDDAPQFNSLWNIYPFFPSGIVIGSDIERGLWVWLIGDPPVDIDLVGGAPATINPNGQNLAVTIIENPPGSLMPGSAQLNYDAGAGIVQVPLVHQGGTNWQATLPALACGTSVRFNLTAKSTSGITFSDPSDGSFYNTVSATGLTTVLADNFETNQGWTVQVQGATAGFWERGIPVNDPSYQYDPMSDSDGSGQCFLTQNILGNSDVDNGAVLLFSPVLDLSAGGATISYDYYLNMTNAANVDRMQVDISSNGAAGPWIQVAQHNTDGGTTWRANTISQAALNTAGVTMTSNMMLRYTVNDSNPQSIVEAGLDRFSATRVQCGCSGSLASFCTAKPGLACGPASIAASGTPSASAGSGFTISAGPARTCKSGILLYNQTQGTATSFEGGTLCVEAMSLRRAGSSNSMGTPGGTNCDGQFAIDMNTFASGAWVVPDCAGLPTATPPNNPAAYLSVPGTSVFTQWWGRDSVATGSFVSNGVSYIVCP